MMGEETGGGSVEDRKRKSGEEPSKFRTDSK